MNPSANIAIIGAGYVGLTTAAALAYLGNRVTCVDIDEEKVRKLQQGDPLIYEPGLQDLMREAGDRLRFTTSYSDAVPEADIVFIAVGTPLGDDGYANLEYLHQAATSVGRHLNGKFTLIVNKSTVPIGCGNWVDSIVRESYAETHGERANGCFAVASNPEFLKEGTALDDTFYPDRIVIGVERERDAEILARLYRPILDQEFEAPAFLPRPAQFGSVPLVTTGIASAELIKYTANAFLAVKISFINQVGTLAEKVGADVTELARGIGLDRRIGGRFLQAGIGWGGSCFGKDTAALAATGREYACDLSIVDAAREANCRQLERVIEKLLDRLKILKGRRIGLLGLSFKPDTDDMRDSPAFAIARRLTGRGAKVIAYDPVAICRSRRQIEQAGIKVAETPEDVFVESD
ncbi:MAG: UDP-glucose/GDP-mannose dehydrogenase family protein, partial [Acidobacteriia bacterium]|nr:UDP-glucose/GDP-mannose dehydrogenase family protein [Terriglobia bacterium]